MPAKRIKLTPIDPSQQAGKPALLDTLAKNRVVPVVDAKSVPLAPAGFTPTPAEERARRLRRLAATQRAEMRNALHEVAGRSAQYHAELGDLAPEPTPAQPLAERLQAVRETIVATEALLTYLYELEEIAQSDGVEFLEAVHTELQHRLPKKPALGTAYVQVLTLFRQRAEAISDGIARNKRPSPAEQPDAQ